MQQVHRQIAHLQHRLGTGRPAAALERFQPGQQLGEGERLDQVVVAARA